MGQTGPFGGDLRSVRKARGMTLEQVAGALGRSVGWLSQVERGLSHPDDAETRALADLLKVPLSLVTPPPSPVAEAGRITRAAARRPIGERVPGLVEHLLSPDLTDDFEVIHSTFAPGTARTDPVIRPTTELAVMISGRLEVWLGDDAFALNPGDTLRIRGEPLRWANPHDTPAVAVWVISPPVY